MRNRESDYDEFRMVPKEYFSRSNAYRRGRREADGVWVCGEVVLKGYIGRQERFNCRIVQQGTRTLEWGLLRIWKCDFDNDPRKDSGVGDCIRRVSYVVEIRDTVVHFMDCIYTYAMNLVKYNGLEILDSILSSALARAPFA